jgi:tRNA (cmo5U34)-methyltransferase
MSHSVRRHLRLDIDAYDESIRNWVPGYEAMLDAAATEVAAVCPELVLDLGAGTGGLSEVLLRRQEIGLVEALDVDPEMLTMARERLARYGNRVRFTEASFEGTLPVCDAVAASLSLHHVPTIEAKTDIYASAFASLQPGGVLVNADVTMPTDDAAAAEVYRVWAEHLMKSGIAEGAAWEHFEAWAEEDHYLPLEGEVQALESAGFETECVWREAHVVVLVGRKPA